MSNAKPAAFSAAATHTMSHAEALPRSRVLVVDDVRSNLLATEAALETVGADVVCVASGAHALEVLASTSQVAVVVLDVMMPEMDGFETLERIRAMPSAAEVPVIFVSANDLSPQAMARAYSLGAFDYVVKPVSSEVLSGKVGAFVTLHQRTMLAARQREALVARDRSVAVLAHDLRTPLGTIATCAELIPALSPGNHKIAEAARRISRATGRMTGLVSDLLEYGRGAALGMPVAKAPADLRAICAQLLEEFLPPPESQQFVADFRGPLIGMWDAGRVGQAISNLLANALRHGEGLIELRAVDTGTNVEITVSNEGTPISEPILPVLFDPLARRKHGLSSLGLGLAIVREVARAHGGGVSVTSNADRTTFLIVLPKVEAPAEATDGA